jgi:hypothetical protein
MANREREVAIREGKVFIREKEVHISEGEVVGTLKRKTHSLFPEKELRCLSPNFHSHVFVADLCIPRIGSHIFCSRIGRPIVGIYKSLTDT